VSLGLQGLTSLARHVKRTLRRAEVEALRGMRRRSALRRVGQPGAQASVLFMCDGNICRSPAAAAIYERLSGRRALSAGFLQPGREAPEHARVAGDRFSIDLRGHRSRVVMREVVGAASLVIVMTRRQQVQLVRVFPQTRDRIVLLGDLDPESSELRDIRDPWGCSLDVFEEVYARIQRCVQVLVSADSTASYALK